MGLYHWRVIQIIFRGYSGFYKDTYLRSSLEFAYAYYLDSKHISWKYELMQFDLDGTSYKPDFYILNDLDEVDYIVEIKSEENKEIGRQRVESVREKYGKDIRLITYKDLLIIYRNEMPISLNKARKMWKEDFETSYACDVSGKQNPMYGKKHNESTKQLIAKKSKERFKDSAYKERVINAAIEGNRKTGYAAQKKPRVKRETRTCAYDGCGNEFIVTISSKKRFCSSPCVSRTVSPLGRDAGRKKSRKHLDQVKEYIDEWAKENKELINETPYNKIKSTLHVLFDDIKQLYNIKDFRIISKAVFGKDMGRKKLLDYLKEIN